MEHRWGRRADTAIDASLFGHPWAQARGCIRDLSMTGAFVQTRLPLPPLTQLDIELHLWSPNGRKAHRVAASVVRTTSEGLGVEWCEPLTAEFVRMAAKDEFYPRPQSYAAIIPASSRA